MQREKLIFTLFIIFYIALALYAMGRFSQTSHWGNAWHGATLANMVNGTAEKPYVYRVLVSEIIAFFVQITPVSVQQSAGAALMTLKDCSLIDAVFLQPPHPHPAASEMAQFYMLSYMRMITGIVLCLFLAGYTIALYKLAATLFPGEQAMILFTPLIGLIAVPALNGFYIYDFSALCLATCGYYCLAVKQWRWYLFWFTLACLNKETSVFLCIFYGLWFYRRLPAPFFAKYLGIQLAIYAVIKGAITWWFRDNPGVFIMTRWQSLQASTIMEGYNYHALIINLAGIFMLVHHWQEKPLFARCGLWNFLLMLIAFFLFGHPHEYRVFYDVMPLLVVLITHTLIETTGISQAGWFKTKDN